MFSERMEKAINSQINAELFSSYLYLSMSAYFTSVNLSGFANWMMVQYKEENTHAMKMYNYINQRSGKVVLTAIDAPKTTWNSPLNAFEDVLAHERKVTTLINDLMDVAIEEHDHASRIFLQWFVTEQIEEEANADDVIKKLKLLGDSKDGLFMMDKELGQRTFVDETTAA